MASGSRERAERKERTMTTVGETTYEKFKRCIDALPEHEQSNFMARIISRFADLHELELRDIIGEEYQESLAK